jgi:hypothetical protein
VPTFEFVVVFGRYTPDPGSVRQYDPNFCMLASNGTHLERCSSLPNLSIIQQHMLVKQAALQFWTLFALKTEFYFHSSACHYFLSKNGR